MAAPISRVVLGLSNKLLVKRHVIWKLGPRFLLTAEYKCDDEWRKRLQSPLLQKVNIESFMLQVQEKLDKEGSASSVDMDIIANKLDEVDPLQLDFIQNLFYRFRHSRDAISARDSMSHAIIRCLLATGETERLMHMLRDKIHYGVFLDYFTANILLDHFIEHQQYKDGAEIAVDLMLQEELSHPLCRALCWQACRLRVDQLLTDASSCDELEAQADDGELIYHRVGFIENPWYDDHFDLPTERHRIGKTLTVLASPADDLLSRGDLLLGLALYEKLDKVLEMMTNWLQDSTLSVAVTNTQMAHVHAVIDSIRTHSIAELKEPGLRSLTDEFPLVTEQQKADCLAQFTELLEKLKSAGKLTDSATDADTGELARRVSAAIASVGLSDIRHVSALYSQWISDRQRLIDEQIEQQKVAQRKRDIARRLVELRAREEKLRYFEEQAKIELKIAELPSDWEKPATDEVSEEQFVAAPGERRADAGKRSK